ncbi:hypothetical protein BBTM_01140 [Bifidobacterium bifidum]|nr:hypothetical protein BBTM_01140 [Bifidobacterium bifidum]
MPCRIWQSPCHCSPASSFFALRGNRNRSLCMHRATTM